MPLEQIAVDAATQYLVGVAGRSFRDMVGMKRSARSRTSRNKKQKSGEGEGPERSGVTKQGIFTQLAYSKDSWGREIPLSSLKARVSEWSGAVQWITQRFGRLTSDALKTGTSALAYQLKYLENATISVGTLANPGTASGAAEYPLHIFSLCDRHNNDVSRDDLSGPGRFAYTDVVGTSSPQLKFGYLTGTRNDGVAMNDWDVWSAYAPTTEANFASHDVTTSILKNVRIQMLLQGAKGSPTTFHLDLVRVSEDYYGPNAEANFSRDEAFFPMIRKLLGNPVNGLPMGPKKGGTMSVVKSWTYYLAPGTNLDYDVTPSQRHVDLDLQLNQTIKWNWSAQGTGVGRLNYDDANLYNPRFMVIPKSIAASVYPPDHRDRWYFVVRATNTQVGVETGETIPQYDLRILATHVFNVANNDET